jgi:hypothetical protein
MSMLWRHFALGVLAALAVVTWTAPAPAGGTEPGGPNEDVTTLTLGADVGADTVPVAYRGGTGFRPAGGFSNRFAAPQFHRFDGRSRFRQFDRIEDRLEAQLRRTNPALFRQFDRIEDRLEARRRFGQFGRFDNRFAFRRFDRTEDRLEAQLRRANPTLFRQFDRIEDRLEARLRFGRFTPIADRPGDGAAPTPVPGRLAYGAYGDGEPAAVPPAPGETRTVTLPVRPAKPAYRGYGE